MAAVVTDSDAKVRDELQSGRGPVVVVPVHDAWDDVVRCVASLVRHTPADIDLLLVDDGSTDPRVQELGRLGADAPQRVLAWHRHPNVGFVGTMNAAFAAAGRRDVVLVNSDVIVGAAWLERLRDAAYSHSRVATASALANHGTILSVPTRNTASGLVSGLTPETAAAAVAAASGRLRPRIPTCVGHCTYVKRMALDLVGAFDEAFAPGYGEEVDFSQRCVVAGLAHVCADDVFVYHRGGASFVTPPQANPVRAAHERLIAARYPFYHAAVAATAGSDVPVLAASIANARRALLGFTVAVDATSLGPFLTGTQRGVIEGIRALARHDGVRRVGVVLPAVVPDYVTGVFDDCPAVELIRADRPLPAPADVAWRPVQVFGPQDLSLLRSLGTRVVVSQLDFIAYDNPSYYPSPAAWLAYRDVTRLALALADGVTFVSQDVERAAREEGLLQPGQPTKVIYNGVDHSFVAPVPVPPRGIPDGLAAAGYVLCFGTDFRHKNRLFALRTFAAMAARGYPGAVVLAGPQVELGATRAEEEAFRRAHPDLAARIVILPEVSEAERAWLFAHAALLLNPSLHEGFGLTPFEAAAAGVPCLSSTVSALEEILPRGIEAITDWDPAIVAAQALGIMADAGRRAALVEAIALRGRDFTWDGVAGRLVAFFDALCRLRRSPRTIAIEGEHGVVTTVDLPPPALPALPNGDGTLGIEALYPREFNEAMRAIGQRPLLRRPIAGVLSLGYRIASHLRTRLVRVHGGSGGPGTR